MRQEILTAEEVANILRMPEADVERLAQAGRIPHLRVGDYLRFPRDAFERWLEGSVNGGPVPVAPVHRSRVRRRGARNRTRLINNGRSLEIELQNPHTALTYTLIPVHAAVREFFPGYKVPFVFSADGEEIRTHVTGAKDGTATGDRTAGTYIRYGLISWFNRHRRAIRPGTKLLVHAIRPGKAYSLEVVDR